MTSLRVYSQNVRQIPKIMNGWKMVCQSDIDNRFLAVNDLIGWLSLGIYTIEVVQVSLFQEFKEHRFIVIGNESSVNTFILRVEPQPCI